MAPITIYPYRDRTPEFRSLSESLKKKIEEIPAINRTEIDQSQPRPSSAAASRSEFNKKAARIGSGIHEASQKIGRLAKLAKRSSMFDDPIVEIQELTALIKDDITGLNMALLDLQALQSMVVADGSHSEDKIVHSTAVSDALKNKLMGATKELQDILIARTENIKAHESRKMIFSANAARESSFQSNSKTRNERAPWSRLYGSSAITEPTVLPSNGVQLGCQLRRRSTVDNTPSHHMEVSMLQQVVPRQSHTQSRTVALQNVESTISELSGIFTHLATMVAHQGELTIRIDDYMDESLANVEGAQNALLTHLSLISSNRWLLIKIFAILILFLMVYIFFIT